MSWWDDVQDALMAQMDNGKDERDKDKNIAMLTKAVDEMCEKYLSGKNGAETFTFEVAPNKLDYMLEVLVDPEIQAKWVIDQEGKNIYIARQKEITF